MRIPALIAALALASIALVWAGCGDEEEAAAPSEETAAESADGEEEGASTGGPAEDGPEPADGARDPQARELSPEEIQAQGAETRERFQQARDRFDQIRRAIDEAREAGTLDELAERYRAGGGGPERAREFCLELGLQERICDQVSERLQQREPEGP